MKLHSFPICLLTLLFIPCVFYAQEDNPVQREIETAIKFRAEALSKGAGFELLRGLCELGPRLSGSASSQRSITWITEKMRALGYDTVYLQEVWVPRWERGRIESAVVSSPASRKVKQLTVCALGGSMPAKSLTAEVLEVSSFEELQKAEGRVRGKIVFYNVLFDKTNLNTFASYGKNARYRVHGAIEAAKYGAVAVLVRSITSKHDNVPHTGVMAYRDTLPRIPGAAIGTVDADVLHAVLKREPRSKLTLTLDCSLHPDVRSYNVIGEIRGAEFPQSILLAGGHFDSWDKGDGAHDDGAGCVHSIEAVTLFIRLGIRPRNTLRTVLFINEENGSRGAARYAAVADSLGEKHLAAIESDRGGFLPQGFNVENNDSLIKVFQKYLPALKELNILWMSKGGGGVDISAIKNCNAKIGFVPDCQRYFDVHHSANDVFEEVHPREFELGSAAIGFMLYLLDNETQGNGHASAPLK